MRVLRTFLSAAAVLIGLLMAAVAVPAIWVDRNIVQEDGFVALTAPLGQDPAFQRRLAGAVVVSLGAEARIPEAFAELAQPVLENAAQSLAGMPGYPDAWAETLRRSHRLSFAGPDALPPRAGGATALTLDAAPLVGLVAKQVTDATGLPLTAPDRLLIHVGQPSQRQSVEMVAAYAPIGYAVAVGAAIAFLLALAAARRRWSVLAGIGAGALVLAGGWKLAADAAGGALAGTSSGNEVADIFKREFVAASMGSFGQWILIVAAAGTVLLAGGLVLRLAGGPKNRRV